MGLSLASRFSLWGSDVSSIPHLFFSCRVYPNTLGVTPEWSFSSVSNSDFSFFNMEVSVSRLWYHRNTKHLATTFLYVIYNSTWKARNEVIFEEAQITLSRTKGQVMDISFSSPLAKSPNLTEGINFSPSHCLRTYWQHPM